MAIFRHGRTLSPRKTASLPLIDVVNDRFGTDFNQADQLFFDQIIEAAISDSALRQAAMVNPGDKFELVFKNLLEALLFERMDQNEDIFARFMNDRSFQKVVTGWLSTEAYRKLNSPGEYVNEGGMRGDLLGAVERRRRWTDAEKFAVVCEVGRHGASVTQVAQRHVAGTLNGLLVVLFEEQRADEEDNGLVVW